MAAVSPSDAKYHLVDRYLLLRMPITNDVGVGPWNAVFMRRVEAWRCGQC